MTNLEALLNQYENGSLSRRDLLAALALLVAAPAASSAAQTAKPIGAVKSMNHVTAFVPNVQKSVDFYQGLFGMPILTRQGEGINLSAGSSFWGIYPAPAGATTGSVNHVCFGMENFDADTVLKQLTDRGIKGNIRMRGDTKELYFTDPDGIRVQLQDVKYIGGTGVLGDKPPK
ncbi:MAG: VOC family protein [Cyanobacteria bacterium]|nr:VOC family protein [Cyanobacteriota bacterium]